MSKRYRYLLAKRSASPEAPLESETLKGHIVDVVRVAEVIVGFWGRHFLESLRIPQNWESRLKSATLRGALLHDLGKANHQFQRLVRKGPIPPQALRHEWISLLITLRFAALQRWIFSDDDDLVQHSALFAAAGHHLQIPTGAIQPREGSGDACLEVLMGHADVSTLLESAGELLGIGLPAPAIDDFEVELFDDPMAETRPWFIRAHRWWERLGSEERRFVAATKALVIAADVAGSALPRFGVDPSTWVSDVLSRTCTRASLEQLAARGLEGKPIRAFQSRVAETESVVTLVRAGCGSGKTTAAYLWAARKAGGKKLFFCYPTTGTATEGYKDYVLESSDGLSTAEASLVHSRAEVDLEEISGTPECDHDRQLRFESLSTWDVPLVVCTADTVLGLVQNSRRGLFSFPSIANGGFVFDEVHAYDDRMFQALLRFLDAFPGAPALLMTASLPQSRLKALRDLAQRLGNPIFEVDGPTDLEAIPRYQLAEGVAEEVWMHVERTLRAGGKVLWVANTVERAVSYAKRAVDRGISLVLPYHSRYRYCDRLKKHSAVIDAFRSSAPVLAVSTQVCEVSLNLSADLLVTDLAPVPSLIQRLGRLNRFVSTEYPAEPKLALVLEPGSASPYQKVELERARQWLRALGQGILSQSHLAQGFVELGCDDVAEDAFRSAWLDGGPLSSAVPLREAEATISVIRAEEAEAARRNRKHAVRVSIPMLLGPISEEVGRWSRIGVSVIAPPGRIEYSEEWGARWRN